MDRTESDTTARRASDSDCWASDRAHFGIADVKMGDVRRQKVEIRSVSALDNVRLRGLHRLWAILLAVGLIGTPPLAQAQLSENPIAPGFWSFANRKSEATGDVRAACRNYIEIRFADGHYIGLRIYKTESGVVVREVGEVGRCTFNRETQVEHCDKRLIKPDGSIMLGSTESRYSFGNDKALKMTVTPKMVTDTPFTNAPFDAFPVHCPDDAVWSILNEVGRSR